jgi:hypothetical protein
MHNGWLTRCGATLLCLLLCVPLGSNGQEPRPTSAERRFGIVLEESPAAAVSGVPVSAISEAIPPWGRDLPEPSPFPPLAQPVEFSDVEGHSPSRRWWFNVEYLLWWTRNGMPPPLVTRGELSDPLPGALDQPNTKVLYGGEANEINFQERHGGRFTFGMALDPEGVNGLEAGYFFLTARSVGIGLASPGSPILAQPFYNVATNANDSSLATYPGLAQGSISVRSTSFLQGAEANVTRAVWQCEQNRLSLIAGFRYLNLHEDLQVGSNSVGDPGSTFAGASFEINDRFATWNDFYGAQVGLSTEWHYRRLQFTLLGKVALGDTVQTSQVTGRTVTNFPTSLNAPAGLLALSSNSGTFTRNAFAVVPEVGATLGFRITDHLLVFAGYTFLYWNDVARPGNQVDLALNPNLIPTSTTFGVPGGAARPAPGVHGTEFWAQGVNIGLTLHY